MKNKKGGTMFGKDECPCCGEDLCNGRCPSGCQLTRIQCVHCGLTYYRGGLIHDCPICGHSKDISEKEESAVAS